MVGVLEADQRHCALLSLFRLIVGDRADHLGGEAVTAGNLPGDLRLVHRLRGIEPTEENEEIAQRENDQNQEKQTPADQDSGVELGGSWAHGGWGKDA